MADPVEIPVEKVVDEQATAAPAEVVTDEDAEYQKAFDAQVAKRELDKLGDEEVPDPEAAKEPAKDEAPIVEKPEQKPAPKMPEPDKEAAKAEPAPTADWIDLLPEDRREAARAVVAEAALSKKREQDLRSVSGRVSAYQKRYEELAGKRPAEVKKEATAEQAAEWTQFETDYPDIAKAIEVKFKTAHPDSDATVRQLAEYVEQQQRERFLHDAWDAVEAVHPNWRDTGKSTDFQTWKASSPTYDKLASSDDIADAIALFDLYEAHRVRNAPATKTVDPKVAAEAAKLAARRGAQVQGAQTTTSRSAAPNTNVDLNDEDQLFAHFASTANKRLKARYS